MAAIFLEPTVIADVAPDAVISQEEIFGPVLAVIKVANFEEGIKVANNTEYGLTGALYTNDRDRLNLARTEYPRRKSLFQPEMHRGDGRGAPLWGVQYEWD